MALSRLPLQSGLCRLLAPCAVALVVACSAEEPTPLVPSPDVADTSNDAENDVGEDTAEPDTVVPDNDIAPEIVEDILVPTDTADAVDVAPDAPDTTPEVVEDVIDPPDGDFPNYAGEWAGNWEAEGALPLSGSFVLVIEPHDGDVVQGEATFTGAPCFSFAYVDAVIQRGVVTATLSEDEISISVAGTITATELTATFEAVDAGICSGYTGIITATRLTE